jgi:heme-degrading monooxygenase HmoA
LDFQVSASRDDFQHVILLTFWQSQDALYGVKYPDSATLACKKGEQVWLKRLVLHFLLWLPLCIKSDL